MARARAAKGGGARPDDAGAPFLARAAPSPPLLSPPRSPSARSAHQGSPSGWRVGGREGAGRGERRQEPSTHASRALALPIPSDTAPRPRPHTALLPLIIYLVTGRQGRRRGRGPVPAVAAAGLGGHGGRARRTAPAGGACSTGEGGGAAAPRGEGGHVWLGALCDGLASGVQHGLPSPRGAVCRGTKRRLGCWRRRARAREASFFTFLSFFSRGVRAARLGELSAQGRRTHTLAQSQWPPPRPLPRLRSRRLFPSQWASPLPPATPPSPAPPTPWASPSRGPLARDARWAVEGRVPGRAPARPFPWTPPG